MKKILFFILVLSGLSWANSLSEILDRGVLRVGVAKNSPPFSKLTDGKFEGFEIKLAHKLVSRVFAKSKGRIELVGIDSNQRISYLQDNKVDLVISTFSVTADRKKLIDFSTPYFSVDMSMMTRKEDGISSMAGLAGKSVLVEKGTTAIKRLEKSNINKVICNSTTECYRMLKEKKGSAFCSDNTLLLAYVLVDQELELGIKQYGRSDFIAVGIRKNNPDLLKFINEQIIKLSKEGFFKKAFEEELNPFYKGTADKKYFLLDDLYSILGAM